ncbi:MAG: hypothetical protein AMJ43_00770 [Coxiella sp. DG_40]|nr:MAG: hypothetical protein AMJ43_00770 [Coxiella sp. DG_40]
MGYVRNTLMYGERLIFYTRPHGVVFAPMFLWLIISLLILIYGPRLGLNTVILLFDTPLHILLSFGALIIAIIHAISSFIVYVTSEYAVTDKRVLMKIGLIQRNSLEIFLDKIESIKVQQSTPGRILNFGSITISGTGGSKDPFKYIPRPLYFRRQVQEQIEKLAAKSKSNIYL